VTFRLVLTTGQILRDRKAIGKVQRIDGGRHVAYAGDEAVEAFSPEFAAEAVCRKIDAMEAFVVEREKKK